MRTIYLDGQYLLVNNQLIDAFTPGLFKTRGAFETMLGENGLVLDEALHLRRLRRGLKILGIATPRINPLVLKKVLQRNHLSCARVRLMVWRAGPARGRAGRHIHVMAVALPYKSTSKIDRVCLVKTNRAAHQRLANVKSLDYELFAGALAQAKTRGFDEALLLNRRGHIFEASRANIFWIKDKILYTPPLASGCLNGITRQQVIKQAKLLKIRVKEENLTPETLRKADTAFLTNSLIGIKPIDFTSISNIKIA